VNTVSIIAFVCLLIGTFVGFLTAALLRSNTSDTADSGRLDFVASERLSLSRSSSWFVVFDEQKNQVAISQDLREAIDIAAAKLVARSVATENAPAPTEVARAG
jgi:hypothetical protein